MFWEMREKQVISLLIFNPWNQQPLLIELNWLLWKMKLIRRLEVRNRKCNSRQYKRKKYKNWIQLVEGGFKVENIFDLITYEFQSINIMRNMPCKRYLKDLNLWQKNEAYIEFISYNILDENEYEQLCSSCRTSNKG